MDIPDAGIVSGDAVNGRRRAGGSFSPELLSVEKLKASSKPARGKSFESVRYSAMLRGELAGIKVTSLVVGALLHRAP